MRLEHRKFYGRAWSERDRPQALLRAGGRVVPVGFGRFRYLGGARCQKCGYRDYAELKGRLSHLDVAHLDGNPANRDPANLAALCARGPGNQHCHRAHDLSEWARKYHTYVVRKRDERDAARPLLAYGVMKL